MRPTYKRGRVKSSHNSTFQVAIKFASTHLKEKTIVKFCNFLEFYLIYLLVLIEQLRTLFKMVQQMKLSILVQQKSRNFVFGTPLIRFWTQFKICNGYLFRLHTYSKFKPDYAQNYLLHPAGSSVNSTICEEISKFFLNVNQLEGCCSYSFSVKFPQLSKSSKLYHRDIER